jgi:hypothetical protein
VYDGLHPESLTGTDAEKRQTIRRMNLRLDRLQKELGRKVSEHDCWRWEGNKIQLEMAREQGLI